MERKTEKKDDELRCMDWIEEYFLFCLMKTDFYKAKFSEYVSEIKKHKENEFMLKDCNYFFNQFCGNSIPSSEKS